MAYIFRVHEQQYFPVHGHGQFTGYDIVPSFDIIRGIQAKEILISFVNFVGVKCAEFPVGPGVTKIKRKLPGLRLDLQGVRPRRGKVNSGTSVSPENAERKRFCANENERRGAHHLAPPGKIFGFVEWPTVGELPHKGRKDKL